MEPQNNSDIATKIPSPSDPVVTSDELKLPLKPETEEKSPPAPESLTATEAVTPETPPEPSPSIETKSDLPPTPPQEPQLPPISPQVPPIVFNAAPTEPPLPPPVSEVAPPKKGSKLILIGIILLIVFLTGYAYITFSGVISK